MKQFIILFFLSFVKLFAECGQCEDNKTAVLIATHINYDINGTGSFDPSSENQPEPETIYGCKSWNNDGFEKIIVEKTYFDFERHSDTIVTFKSRSISTSKLYDCQESEPCDNNQTHDEFGNCIDVPPCPDGQHYESSAEECVCDNGLPKINGQCQVPHCPLTYGGFPLQAENLTNFECIAQGGDSAVFLADDRSDLTCCYYSNQDQNNTCPEGTARIGDICVPIEPPGPDDNDTDPYDCPPEQYYSFEENGCVPFFPDDNDTDPDNGGGSGGDAGGGSGSTDGNNSGGGTGGGTDGGSGGDSNGTGTGGGVSDDYHQDLKDIKDSVDSLKDLFDLDFTDVLADLAAGRNAVKDKVSEMVASYELNYNELRNFIGGLRVPTVHFSGTCSLGFTVFGKHVDLSSGLVKIIPVLRPVVMLFLNIYFAVLLLKLSILAYRDVTEKFIILFVH